MTVCITGASQGIGEALARAFAAEPAARLALVARSRETLEAVADDCERLGARAAVFPCDLTDAPAVARLARDLEAFGVPDVLVNNAGHFAPGGFAETTPEAFAASLAVNLTSAFLLTRALLPAMLARAAPGPGSGAGSGAPGRVLFMGSVASVRGYPGGTAYCAAKHGLLGLARALRAETLGAGLAVTTLLPGATVSPSWDGADVDPERLMPAEDLARLAVEVCRMSPRSVVEEVLVRPRHGDL